ncbi:MAG: helix-turn-helix domain-containing protein [Bacillota bacterium]
MKKYDASDLGVRIREERERVGLGLNDFARQIGLSPSYLSEVERGQRPQPSFIAMRAVAERLNVSLDYLAGLVESRRYAKLVHVGEISPEYKQVLQELGVGIGPDSVDIDGSGFTTEQIHAILTFIRLVKSNQHKILAQSLAQSKD